ncbi:hypothetical protein [Kitasatospora terrestris]|uniref:Excreted virulence factor EspC (Type VII ESX diderm) n=1 Tax=Kitasatospora terrestris TaxID=258051 RepID=A0ABP9E688_9ACTN
MRPGEESPSAGFSVDPPVLDRAGRSAQDLSHQVPQGRGGLARAGEEAGSGINGFATEDSLGVLTDSWQVALDRLSVDMDQQGNKLIETADRYRRADQESIHHLHGAGAAG